MRKVIMALLLAAAASGPSAALSQDARGNIPTDTQSRLADARGYNPLWDVVGLLGLLGLLGLWRSSDNDGYTDDPI